MRARPKSWNLMASALLLAALLLVAVLSPGGMAATATAATAATPAHTDTQQLSFSDFFSAVDKAEFFHTFYQRDTLVNHRKGVDDLTPAMRDALQPMTDLQALCNAFEQQDEQRGGFQVRTLDEKRRENSPLRHTVSASEAERMRHSQTQSDTGSRTDAKTKIKMPHVLSVSA